MRLSDLGEFSIIERIAKRIKIYDKSVIKAIGDDTAVIKIDKKNCLLLTTDMLIEDIHFKLGTATPFKIGHKALGCGLSDIAAMGGIPKYALVSVGLKRAFSVEFVDGIYKGINALAKRFRVSIIGGDTNASEKVVIDVTVIGQADIDKVIYRDGAKVGDIIFVTGKLGGSSKGRHLTFMPRINEAQYLVKNFKVNSMIDLSDGLSSDLNHLTAQSKVGAVIYKELIPKNTGASLNDALNEGEDYELLFTMPVYEAKKLIDKKYAVKIYKTPVTAIGQIVTKDMGCIIIEKNGKAQNLVPKGFAHF